MKKVEQQEVVQDATEIIELAINDIDTLTRAFEMISRVCEELDPKIAPLPELRSTLIN